MKYLVTILSVTLMSFVPDQAGFIDPAPLRDMINEYRISKGLRPLEHLEIEQQNTDAWARQLRRNFNHAGAIHYYHCENIARTNAEYNAIERWKQSPGHNKAMLLRDIKYMTVSIYFVPYSTSDAYFAVFRGYKEKAPN